MSRVIGYICSDDSLTHVVMDNIADEVEAFDETETGGRGFGWVQEGRSLLRKQPRERSRGVTLASLLSDIPSRAIVGHERETFEGAVDTLDLQPYSFRTWVYAQVGGVAAMEQVADDIKAEIPDHIRRNIEGKTIEELCFHRFLTVLSERNDLELTKTNARRGAESLARAIRALESRLEDVDESDGRLNANIVTVSDRLLLAARTQGPMYYRIFDGIEEPVDEPLFAGHRPKPEKHPHFNAVLVTNELDESPGEEWQMLGPQHVMWIDEDWSVEVAGIDELIENNN